jgi:hypothetical protein
MVGYKHCVIFRVHGECVGAANVDILEENRRITLTAQFKHLFAMVVYNGKKAFAIVEPGRHLEP